MTNCITEINNAQVDNAKDVDTVMPMYNLIEHGDNYSKTSGSFWQYCKNIPAVNNNGNIVGFNRANASDSVNFKAKITGQTGTKGVEMMVSLEYLSNFWRTLEMPLISCEIILIFTWSENHIVVCTDVANQGAIFAITETTLFVPVATLSTLWLRVGGDFNQPIKN